MIRVGSRDKELTCCETRMYEREDVERSEAFSLRGSKTAYRRRVCMCIIIETAYAWSVERYPPCRVSGMFGRIRLFTLKVHEPLQHPSLYWPRRSSSIFIRPKLTAQQQSTDLRKVRKIHVDSIEFCLDLLFGPDERVSILGELCDESFSPGGWSSGGVICMGGV